MPGSTARLLVNWKGEPFPGLKLSHWSERPKPILGRLPPTYAGSGRAMPFPETTNQGTRRPKKIGQSVEPLFTLIKRNVGCYPGWSKTKTPSGIHCPTTEEGRTLSSGQTQHKLQNGWAEVTPWPVPSDWNNIHGTNWVTLAGRQCTGRTVLQRVLPRYKTGIAGGPIMALVC